LGILAIYSTRPDQPFWLQQLTMAGIGVALMLVLAQVNYKVWLAGHWLFYALSIGMLVAVISIGVGSSHVGADRWLSIGGIQVQPSEFAKLSVILSTAAILHRHPIRQFHEIWRAALVILPPWMLVFLQPDLGTSLIFIPIALGMLYWAGARLSWLILLLSPAVAAIIYGFYTSTQLLWVEWVWLVWSAAMAILAVWQLPWRWLTFPIVGGANLLAGQLGQVAWHVLKPYQQQRLIIFMDPTQDPLGAGYHIIQSKIAIGAGGLWGRGLMHGTQTQLSFIPEQHTDFIFAAIGEELGFVGALVVLFLVWTICFRLIAIALQAKDNFGSLVAIGTFSTILFQAVVNIGMTVGLMPVTGLPLPFVSYGRSALLTYFVALGIVESVAKYHERKTIFS
jgi:rod shape determining protein RodA